MKQIPVNASSEYSAHSNSRGVEMSRSRLLRSSIFRVCAARLWSISGVLMVVLLATGVPVLAQGGNTPAPTIIPTANPTTGATGAPTANPGATPTTNPTASTTPTPAPAPTIDSFSPLQAGVGSIIAITGTSFTGATAVSFNGTAAAFTVDSATRITAIVPNGATSGPISITTPAGTIVSVSSFLVAAPTPTPSGDRTAPTLTFVSPSAGAGISGVSQFPDVLGTVSDGAGGSGVNRVELTLRRQSDGKYWDGQAWVDAQSQPGPTPSVTPAATPGSTPTPTSPGAPVLATTLNGDGTFSRLVNLPDGSDLIYDVYTLVATAVDNVGNRGVITNEIKIEPLTGSPTPTPTVGSTPTPQATAQTTGQPTAQPTTQQTLQATSQPTTGSTPQATILPTSQATATSPPVSTPTPRPTATSTPLQPPPPGVMTTPQPTPTPLAPEYTGGAAYMISIPYMDGSEATATTTPNRAFNLRMVENGRENYRLYGFDALTQQYGFLDGDSLIQRGRGYFLAPLERGLRLKSPNQDASRRALAEGTFTITLRRDPSREPRDPENGYNLIGFPFDPHKYRSVEWEESIVTTPDGRTFNDLNEAVAAGVLERTLKTMYEDSPTYFSTTTMRPFKGYWARTFIDGVQVTLLGRVEKPLDEDPVAPVPTATATPFPLPVGTATPGATPNATSAPDSAGRIAFVSFRDGNAEIYIMNADGSGQTRLTNNPGADADPAISHDGKRIVFASDRDGDYEIYIMNSDGSGQTRLTTAQGSDLSPVFSPDDTKILFDSRRGPGTVQIYTMNMDGSAQTELKVGGGTSGGQFPTYNSDGSKIAFEDSNASVSVMNADGTGVVKLTSGGGAYRPSFSPVEDKITFSKQENANPGDVWIINGDGSGQVRLTSDPASDEQSCFSPDGKQIAFMSGRNGNSEIFVMNVDGTNQVNRTNNPALESRPFWGVAAGAGPAPTPTPAATAGSTPTPQGTPFPTPTTVSGSPVTWGLNDRGQLGDGTTTTSRVPILVNTSGVLAGKTVTSMVGGQKHTLAIADGKIYAWGVNSTGQLGDGTTSDSSVPVAVNTSGALAGKTITAVAAGLVHNLALDSDGKVYAWGDNPNGQLGTGSNLSSLVPVAVSTGGALAGKRVIAIGAGWKHSLALTSDGQLYSWGDNGLKQLGRTSAFSSDVPVAVDMTGALAGKTVTSIAVGLGHNLVVASDGKVYAWGLNSSGQVGNGTDGGGSNNASISLPVAVQSSGVMSGKTIVAVAASNLHSLALTSEGKVYAWGSGSFGELGDGANTNSNVPVAVDTSGVLAGKTIIALAGGNTHSLALDVDGKVYAWGNSSSGQLGVQGNITGRVPVAVDTSGVLAGKRVVAISGGTDGFHSLALVGSAENPTPTPGSTPTGDDLIIAQNRATTATIVVADNAGTWERQAATDLQKYIELMSGARPSIANTIPAGTAPVLVVGNAALAAEPTLSTDLNGVVKKNPTVRADAVVVRRSSNRIYMAGTNDESHYFAATWLLQQWGCRWYLPTDFGEVIPEQAELKVGSLNFVYAPPFEIRHYWISWNGSQQGAVEFRRRNFMTETSMAGMGHALGTYTADIAPAGGTVFNVPFSEPATAQHVAAKIEADYAAGKNISLAIEDGNYSNNSASDQALITEYDKYMLKPSLTDAMMTLYNNVGRILRQKYPNSTAKIGGMAYANVTMPPRIVTQVEPNVVMWIAPIDIDPIHGMDDPKSPPREEYQQMMEKWAELMGGRLAIYDYDQGMLVWRDMPNPSHTAFAQDVKHYESSGILGIGTESRNAIGTVFTNLFFRGQLMWNPDADVDDMLSDFYTGFYGPAAGPMADYWNAIYDAWDNSIVTEHEYFVAPAIYTPQLVNQLRTSLAQAQDSVASLRSKGNPTRNEALYVQRMDFTQKSFNVIENYMAMVNASATNADYQAAADFADKGLAARDALTAMNPTFTTAALEGNSAAWWKGEPDFMRELLGYTNGSKGTLIAKTPLQWSFKRGTPLPQGWTYTGMEGAVPQGDTSPANEEPTQANGWSDVRTDMYLQSQGILNADGQSYTGHYWYQTTIDLTSEQASGKPHLMFPGLFNEAWLYVNGQLVAHRDYNEPWWLTDYKFTWDVDLSGRLRTGQNVITVRGFNPHHFGGMFRRPFLYKANG